MAARRTSAVYRLDRVLSCELEVAGIDRVARAEPGDDRRERVETRLVHDPREEQPVDDVGAGEEERPRIVYASEPERRQDGVRHPPEGGARHVTRGTSPSNAGRE